MASKKGGSVIGFDPLAWMKGGPAETARPAASASPEPIATPGAPAQDSVFALGEMLTIEQAAAVHAGLGRHLGAPGVTLAAGELQRIDAAGLQLLAAFVQAASGRGTKIAWQAPTAVLRDAARRTGLTTVLRLA